MGEDGALSKRELFERVAREAFRDGVIDPRERDLLTRLQRFLLLSPELARRICDDALAAFRAGALAAAAPLDGRRLHRELVRAATRDGELDEFEGKLLEAMCQLLGVAREDHLATLEEELAAASPPSSARWSPLRPVTCTLPDRLRALATSPDLGALASMPLS